MKKITPVLIIILIIGVVSVSGCISIIDPDNSTQTTDNIFNNTNQTPDNTTIVENVNKNGNNEPVPIEGVMPKLTYNDAREIMDKDLQNNYSINNAEYDIRGYLIEGNPYFNITIVNQSSGEYIGNTIMDANTGEIVYTTLEKKNDKSGQKIYSADEAGAYIDIIYKGEKVSVREKHPYYSPQNNKIYYTQEEEAEDLYQLAKAIKDE